jgi:UDP-glucose 4-epimerase
MKTLVTGGLGFIGSHICLELLSRNIDVVVIDNLENCEIETKKRIEIISNKQITFYHESLLNFENLENICKNENINNIIHCAGHKSVNGSILEPIKYYKENLNMTLNLLEMVKKYNIEKFVFSSSATVYGNSSKVFTENDTVGVGITNPYGKTKYMQEVILCDFFKNYPQKQLVILRYFNPVGCHHSGIIGENPLDTPNNLMPYLMRVASNNYKLGFCEPQYNSLTIFGNDYNTADGTCVRDFIHVVDLARSHICALEYKCDNNNIEIFNIGTGNGTSVLELVTEFEKTNKLDIHYNFGNRREGDVEIVVCDSTKAKKLLCWESTHTIEDIVRDSWNYMKQKDVL